MRALKPLLPLGDATVLQRLVGVFRDAGVDDVRVVLGHRHDEITPLVAELDAQPIRNERYREGMYSSVRTAVETLGTGSTAFFLLPVDIPLVRPDTITLLARERERSGAGIIHPAYGSTRGHPPLIDASYRQPILEWGGTGGLHGLLDRHEDEAVTLQTDDPGVIADMDTFSAYGRARAAFETGALPSRRWCELLLAARFGAVSEVVDHSQAVARLALGITTRLNAAGCGINDALVAAGALLHDFGKGETRHADAGAAALRDIGLPLVAELVAAHLDPPGSWTSQPDEAGVIFLADKLVCGADFVGIDARFSGAFERSADDPDVRGRVEERHAGALRMRELVERPCGETMDATWMSTAHER